MPRYISFMRAINVGGRGLVKMDQLRDVFTAAGGRNVRTLIQSGNVLFESSPRDVAAIERRVKSALGPVLDARPEILTRTVERVRGLVRRDPFKAVPVGPTVKLYVVFLAEQPQRRFAFPLVSAKEALEAIGMDDREVFVVSRRKANGFFGFPNNFVQAAFGVSATSRNWSTLLKLVQFAAEPTPTRASAGGE